MTTAEIHAQLRRGQLDVPLIRAYLSQTLPHETQQAVQTLVASDPLYAEAVEAAQGMGEADLARLEGTLGVLATRQAKLLARAPRVTHRRFEWVGRAAALAAALALVGTTAYVFFLLQKPAPDPYAALHTPEQKVVVVEMDTQALAVAQPPPEPYTAPSPPPPAAPAPTQPAPTPAPQSSIPAPAGANSGAPTIPPAAAPAPPPAPGEAPAPRQQPQAAKPQAPTAPATNSNGRTTPPVASGKVAAAAPSPQRNLPTPDAETDAMTAAPAGAKPTPRRAMAPDIAAHKAQMAAHAPGTEPHDAAALACARAYIALQQPDSARPILDALRAGTGTYRKEAASLRRTLP